MSPPVISVGTPGIIIGNPPYDFNETVTYTCATSYTIGGTADNICSGPPNYNWTLSGSDLPSCRRSKFYFSFI